MSRARLGIAATVPNSPTSPAPSSPPWLLGAAFAAALAVARLVARASAKWVPWSASTVVPYSSGPIRPFLGGSLENPPSADSTGHRNKLGKPL
jgi:hypothetical protein